MAKYKALKAGDNIEGIITSIAFKKDLKTLNYLYCFLIKELDKIPDYRYFMKIIKVILYKGTPI